MPSNKRSPWEGSRRAELSYGRQLRALVRNIMTIIKGYDDLSDLASIQDALLKYSILIKPWAEKAVQRMFLATNQSNLQVWRSQSKELSKAVRETVLNSNITPVFNEQLSKQVHLIQSLPLEAGQRIQALAQESFITGQRAETLASIISKTEEIAIGRARTIARTETSRISSLLTETRAQSVGATGYTWRTSKDPIVRESHRKMEGRYVAWGSPPTLDGLTGHAGQLPNCRCFMEIMLPDI